MFYLLLSIVFSVGLLVNFRLFPRFGVNTTHAISLNYIVCFLTGLALMPKNQHFNWDFSQTWVWFCLILGIGFIVTFLLSGMATQRAGMTATSLANNLSLVIPVMASLFLFGTAPQFTPLNYIGLALAFLALYLVSLKGGSTAQAGSHTGILALVFVFYGLSNTAINYMNMRFISDPARTIPVTLTMVLGAILAGLVLLAYRVVIMKEKITLSTLLASITLGIPNFLSFYFLLLTLSAFSNNGAFIYPIYNIGVILLSAAVSVVFFKEKLSKLNWIGLGIAVGAIVLISYQNLIK